MDESYEELKEGIHELGLEQDRSFWELPLQGERKILPLAGRDIPAVFYLASPDAPVVCGCYGGGFVMGSAANDDDCWAELSGKLGVNLISVGYRKAPEHPYPNALLDVYDSIAYLRSHADLFGMKSEDWSVLGFSAGGNLAAAVCLLDSNRGFALHLKRQILFYPYLDLSTSPAQKGHPKEERMLYTLFAEDYCGGEDPKEEFRSPLYAREECFKGLPRAIVALAESDPLCAEGARYCCRLRSAGVRVDCFTAPDMPHGYVETAFQQPGPYLAKKATEQLLSGQMEREKNRTFDFVRESFGKEEPND